MSSMINLIKYRYWYFAFSLLIIVPGVIFLLAGGLKGGIDFTGGTELTFRFPHHQASTTLEDQLRNAATKSAKLAEAEVVSATPFGGGSSSHARYLPRIPNISDNPQALKQIEAALYQAHGCGSLVTPAVMANTTPARPACKTLLLT